MNYLKLQSDLLKAADKRDRTGKRLSFTYGQTESAIAVIVDEHYIVFIPKYRWYLDIDKVFAKMTPLDLKKIMYEDPEDALPAIDTGITRNLSDGRKVRVFENDKVTIWIDGACLKYFDLSNATFKATEKNKPLYIYETDNIGESLVGYVLPVNY